MAIVHLHLDDTPNALGILNALLGHRAERPTGYVPDEWGADVDWELLTESYLSTTEKATLHIARGCALVECHGGRLPTSVGQQVRAAIDKITP